MGDDSAKNKQPPHFRNLKKSITSNFNLRYLIWCVYVYVFGNVASRRLNKMPQGKSLWSKRWQNVHLFVYGWYFLIQCDHKQQQPRFVASHQKSHQVNDGGGGTLSWSYTGEVIHRERTLSLAARNSTIRADARENILYSPQHSTA